MEVAIVQVGLLQSWLWKPVITHILRPNPSVNFVYFADFHNATAPHRYRKTDRSRAIVDLAHALNAMSAQPNLNEGHGPTDNLLRHIDNDNYNIDKLRWR